VTTDPRLLIVALGDLREEGGRWSLAASDTIQASLSVQRQATETAQQAKDIPTKIYPDLPPQLARGIVGEFSVAVVQTLRKPTLDNSKGLYHPSLVTKDPAAAKVRMWQTRPHQDVEGVTIKAPKEVSEKIPTFVPASYATLMQALHDASSTHTTQERS